MGKGFVDMPDAWIKIGCSQSAEDGRHGVLSSWREQSITAVCLYVCGNEPWSVHRRDSSRFYRWQTGHGNHGYLETNQELSIFRYAVGCGNRFVFEGSERR